MDLNVYRCPLNLSHNEPQYINTSHRKGKTLADTKLTKCCAPTGMMQGGHTLCQLLLCSGEWMHDIWDRQIEVTWHCPEIFHMESILFAVHLTSVLLEAQYLPVKAVLSCIFCIQHKRPTSELDVYPLLVYLRQWHLATCQTLDLQLAVVPLDVTFRSLFLLTK